MVLENMLLYFAILHFSFHIKLALLCHLHLFIDPSMRDFCQQVPMDWRHCQQNTGGQVFDADELKIFVATKFYDL